MCDIITTAKPQIDGGAVEAIAILTDTRSPALAHVPTATEQGFNVQAYTWNAFFTPKGTPDTIIGKLNRAMLESMNDPAIRQKFKSAGLRIAANNRATPQYLDKFVKSEIEKWAGPIKAIGVQID